MRKDYLVLAVVIVAAAGAAQASTLYSTDFELFDLGNLNGQFGWTVNSDPDGQIVDDGTGNNVMQVTAADGGWGAEVRRDYDAPSTKRYLVVEMDFTVMDEEYAFWFMDNGAVGGTPDSIFWGEDRDYNPAHLVCSNAWPGIAQSPYAIGTWYHVGIEVDQQSREIVRFNFDGTWVDDDDSAGIQEPAQSTRMLFRCYSPESGRRLWIDNLVIWEWDAPLGGDVDGNGVVDGLDLTAVLTAWNAQEGDPLWNAAADLDGSGVVDGLDLTEVISNWTTAGAVPEPGVLLLVALGGVGTVLSRVRRGK
jgi:hypothetical protein